MRKTNAIAAAIGLFLLSGSPSVRASESDNDGMPNVKEFNDSIKTFPYEAPADRVEEVTKGYPELALGQSKDDVQRILGNPDFASYIYLAGPPKKFATCKWVYNFHKAQPLFNNPATDKVVQVFFNEVGVVIGLVPLNVEGLEFQGRTTEITAGP